MENVFEGMEHDFAPESELAALLNQSFSRDDTEDMVAFREFYDRIGARFFSADEFMVLGPSHHGNGACKGKNRLADRALWPNMVPLVHAMDAVRESYGAPLVITNCYRSPDYNACVGGVSKSFHKSFRAADFVGRSGSSREWADAARKARDKGAFSGGIGLYAGFVHVDVRGSNADWDNR